MAVVKKKIWPQFFDEVAQNKKKFEVRLNDFEINTGDTLVLEEWDPQTKTYTGRSLEKKVDYVLKMKLDAFGQEEEIKEKGLQVISLN